MVLKGLGLLLAVASCYNGVKGNTCDTLNVHVNGQYKTIKSHNRYGSSQYDSNEDSCWIIQSDARIKLVLDEFNLQPQVADGMCVDYMAVYDSEEGNDDNKRIGTFCGRNPFHTIISTGDRMRIEFYSNGDITAGEGFKLKYKIAGSSELDPGAYWKAGLIFLFIFVFVVVAAFVGVCAAFYTQKKLKPKVILVKKLKGKALPSESRSHTGATYDITGQPTPAGHLYPAPLNAPTQVYPGVNSELERGRSLSSKSPREPASPFTGQGPGMMQPGFGMTSSPTDERVTSPRSTSQRSRPTTATQIRFD